MDAMTAENQNNQQLHVVGNIAGGLNDDHSIDEDQMMQLTDINDLTQEDIVAIPKEIILISLVSQEQALYNPKHENYRNTQRKDIKWMEISEHVGWSETQCKAKWKAMRDQYCRELKRSKLNAKANVKWKYFKELDFLRPYALARNYRPRNPLPNGQVLTHNNCNGASNNNSTIYNNTTTVTSPVTTPPTTLLSSLNVTENNDGGKYSAATIKLENNLQTFDGCDFVNNKSNQTSSTTTTLTEDQLRSVLQHHQNQQTDENSWPYLTASTTIATIAAAAATSNSNPNISRLHHSNHHHQHNTLTDANGGHNLLSSSHMQQQQGTDDALYNALVDCVGQIQQQQQQLCEQNKALVTSASTINHQAQAQAALTTTTDEDDDDPIHTFLNMESYFEKELILLIQSEDILYNCYHQNYRNVKLKIEKWDDIARKLKKTVKQCRLKWKALRDQFIREHKRLKYRDNIETIPRWKHYDALSFLQKFIKHKSCDFDLARSSSSSSSLLLQATKTEMSVDVDMDDDDDDNDDDQMNIVGIGSPLQSPLQNIKLELQQQNDQNIGTIATTSSASETSSIRDQQQQQQHQTLTQIATLTHHCQHNHLHQHSNHTDNLAVSSGSINACYDDMDIDHYIISDVVDDDDNDNDNNDHNDGHSIGHGSVSGILDGSQSCKTEMDNHADSMDEHKAQDDFHVHIYSNSNHIYATNGNSNNNTNKLKTNSIDINSNNINERYTDIMGSKRLTSSTPNRLEQQKEQKQFELTNFKLNSDVSSIRTSPLINNSDIHVMTETTVSSTTAATIPTPTPTLTPTITTTMVSSSSSSSSSLSFNYSKGALTITTDGLTMPTTMLTSSVSPIVNCLSGDHYTEQTPTVSECNQPHPTTTTTATATAATAAATTTSDACTNTMDNISSAGIYTIQQQQQQQQEQQSQTSYQISSNQLGFRSMPDDDEVGAFFKAIAMKIRNAKMSPIAFTDLQIDILKVINCSLRNH